MPKYRQHGYQDSGGEKKPEKKPRPKRDETFGPRPLQMPGKRTVSRCAQCGTLLQELSDPVGTCPKCGFELHSCRQCTYFDPASHFECTQPIPERVARKELRNDCTFFLLRATVERETRAAGAPTVPPGGTASESITSSTSPDDARRAFENLFKK